MTHFEHAGVLTGDIIKSTALSADQLDEVFEQLQVTSDLLERRSGHPLHFTRFRGDGWQVFLREPWFTQHAALAFRAGVKSLGKKFDTRVSIGIGDAHLSGPLLSGAHGSAFTNSGQMLEQMFKANVFGAYLPSPSLYLFQALSSQWTVKQSQIAHKFLTTSNHNLTLVDVAAEFGVSSQTVGGHYDAAHMREVMFSLQLIQKSAESV